MSDVKILKINGTNYNIKDATARSGIATLQTDVSNLRTDVTNNYVTKATAQTITATKTFTGATLGSSIVVNRNQASAVSVISFQVQGTLKGYLGVGSTGNPVYYNASSTGQNLARQKTLNTAQGNTKQPVYVDANGVLQTCNAYSTLGTIGFPDYTNVVSIDITGMGTTNKSFTVPSNGFLQFMQYTTNGGDAFYLDDKAVFMWTSAILAYEGWSWLIPVYAGTHTFRTSSFASRIGGIYFYPLKGAS